MKTLEYKGFVGHGDDFGKILGFPTANLDRRQWSRQKLKLRHGVYSGTAITPPGQTYSAGIVIGPIDRTGKPKVEAHLIGYKGNLYGKRLTINIQQFIRPYKNFSDISQLKAQIAKDIKQVIKLTKNEQIL